MTRLCDKYDAADSLLGDAQVVLGMIEDVTDVHYTDPTAVKLALDRMTILMEVLTTTVKDARELIGAVRPALIGLERYKKVEVCNVES